MVPIRPTSLAVPPPAYAPAGARHMSYQVLPTIPSLEAARRSSPIPPGVPSYYASTPRRPILPPSVIQGLPERGWDYTAPRLWSPPPLDVSRQ